MSLMNTPINVLFYRLWISLTRPVRWLYRKVVPAWLRVAISTDRVYMLSVDNRARRELLDLSSETKRTPERVLEDAVAQHFNLMYLLGRGAKIEIVFPDGERISLDDIDVGQR